MLLRKTKPYLAAAALVLCALALLLFSEDALQGGRDGIALCVQTVIPSLYPFFAVSSMMVTLGFADKLGRLAQGIMRPLFSLSGACSLPVILGLISGSPSGVRSCVELCSRGIISKDDAERVVGFCNNCGPAFIIGMVGGTLFSSVRLGVYLYAVHIFSSLAFGIMTGALNRETRGSAEKCSNARTVGFARAFTDSVTGAWASILTVCAFVIFFSVMISVLRGSGVLGAAAAALGKMLHRDSSTILQVLTGFFEMTAGVAGVDGSSLKTMLVTTSFTLGWSGLSSLFQALAVMSGSGLSPKRLIVGKLFQGLCSALVTYLTADIAIAKFVPAFMPIRGNMVSSLSPGFTVLLVFMLFIWISLAAVFTRKQG